DFCPILIGHKDQLRYGDVIRQMIPQAQFQMLGSFGLKVIEVICGRAGFYLYLNGRVKLWDTTGPLALARAAGLICCDLEGQPIRFTPDAIDPNTLTHQQPILIGWPRYIEALRPRLAQALAAGRS
ncbi:MAG TPA: inositol monophosphatase family protein, partial [Candidatus Caenarcaniphilales bacterium]